MASGGLHPGKLDRLCKLLGKDIGANAGGGVHGHPKGTRAGAKAMRAAADAVGAGLSLKAAAKKSPELRDALMLWKI
jgi:ribulose-bisphosphate carboxylase large chain